MMSLSSFFRKNAAGAVLGWAVGTAAAHPAAFHHQRSAWVLQRVEMVMRHGIRSPLPWQVPHDVQIVGGWPQWEVPAGDLTPHGAEAVRLVGQFDRAWLGQMGVLSPSVCPAPGRVQILTNTAQRTIGSGTAFRDGFAPGCNVVVETVSTKQADARFAPLDAVPQRFDMPRLVPQLPDPQHLYQRDDDALQGLGQVVQCHEARCAFLSAPSVVKADQSGHGLALSGPVADGASLAEALVLAYTDHRPTGWGGLSAAALGRLTVLHADMLAVVNRPAPLASRLSQEMRAQLVQDLTNHTPNAPLLRVYVGHDDTIAPLLTALGVHVSAPGMAEDEIPVGSALIIAAYHQRKTGAEAYQVLFQAQSLSGLRALGAKGRPVFQVLSVPGCGLKDGFCAPDVVINRLKKGE